MDLVQTAKQPEESVTRRVGNAIAFTFVFIVIGFILWGAFGKYGAAVWCASLFGLILYNVLSDSLLRDLLIFRMISSLFWN